MTVYVCDPVCLQLTGHNLTAIKRYGEFIQVKSKNDVCLVTSKHLEKNLLKTENVKIKVDQFFSHYYPDFIKVSGVPSFIECTGSFKAKIFDLAYSDLCKLFRKYTPQKDDTIFYPSIDYYSLASLVKYLENNDVDCNILVRFIGVMEYDHYKCGVGLEFLLSKLDYIVKSKKINISISAESESIASFIESIVSCSVVITPTLVDDVFFDYPKNNSLFTIVFPGGGRIDKGFGRIAAILQKFEEISNGFGYRAIVQTLSYPESKAFSLVARNLIQNANVILLPATLSLEELKRIFEISNVIVAPYSCEIYKYRSSAIMAESAVYGRPIVASNGCGFSYQIETNALGRLAESDEDFALEINHFRSMSLSERNIFCSHARENFIRFLESSYNKFFRFEF